MMWYLLAIIQFLAIYSAYRAVMETRTAPGAVAWVVFLLSMPLLSLPAYWVFGRNRFEGYRAARQLKDRDIHDALQAIYGKLSRFHFKHRHPYDIDVVSNAITEFPTLTGNRAQLLIDGEATFESILEGIDAAQSYILFQFYIVKDGTLAQRVQKHLCSKARAGVSVYFLYDEIGSHALSARYLDTLQDAGVHVSAFNTTKGWRNRFQLNFRNHRKVVVIDGKSCWIGGHNVGDEYIGRSIRYSHWRDTHLRIDGPAALATQMSFAEDWYWATDQMIETLQWRPEAVGQIPVLILPTGPADRLETAGLMFTHFIHGSRHRFWLASPYFVPDEATLAALQLAALRGVDVRVLLPEKPDHYLVYLAAFSFIESAQKCGVKFYRYTRGFMHHKVFIADNDTAAIGTANFDNRSFRLNFEITTLLFDDNAVAQSAAMFETDLKEATEVPPESIVSSDKWFRFKTKAARLAAPVL